MGHFLKKNNLKLIKQLIYGFVIIIVVLFTIEISLHIAYSLIINLDIVENIEGGKWLLSPYKGKNWARKLFEEIDETKIYYEQFIEWDRKEYHGEYLNINAQGIRNTWQPQNCFNERIEKIYVFGGSTIWGHGARDDYTIPSFLAKLFNKKECDFFVYNYGERAYTFTQEIIHLVLLLREGHRPNYVIFYDGINDVYSAYLNGKAGSLYDSAIIKNKLEMSEFKMVYSGLLNIIKRHSIIYKCLKEYLDFVFPRRKFYYGEVAFGYKDVDLKSLGDKIIEYYFNSIKLLDYLANAYNFKYICFWQPSMFTEEKLTQEERNIDLKINDKKLCRLYRYINNNLKLNLPPHLYNISDALNNKDKTIYIDCAHLSEEGNDIISNEIFLIFNKEV